MQGAPYDYENQKESPNLFIVRRACFCERCIDSSSTISHFADFCTIRKFAESGLSVASTSQLTSIIQILCFKQPFSPEYV